MMLLKLRHLQLVLQITKHRAGMEEERVWDRGFKRNIDRASEKGVDVNEELENEWPGGGNWFNRFLKSRIPANATIAEVGPGTGRLSQYCFPLADRYYFVDYSKYVCDLLSEKFPDGITIHATNCDISLIPDDSCDLFFSISTFGHLFEEQVYKYIDQAYDKLVKGGHLVLHCIDLCGDMDLFIEHMPTSVDTQRCVFRFLHPDYALCMAKSVGFESPIIERNSGNDDRHYFLLCQK